MSERGIQVMRHRLYYYSAFEKCCMSVFVSTWLLLAVFFWVICSMKQSKRLLKSVHIDVSWPFDPFSTRQWRLNLRIQLRVQWVMNFLCFSKWPPIVVPTFIDCAVQPAIRKTRSTKSVLRGRRRVYVLLSIWQLLHIRDPPELGATGCNRRAA